MKTKAPNILAQTPLIVLIVLTLSIIALTAAAGNARANAPSANNAHLSLYIAAPGEIVKGQVTVMNPTNEVKIINAHIQEEAYEELNNKVLELLKPGIPRCSEGENGWIRIPEANHKISANQKVVVRYDIGVPTDLTEGCYEALHLEENFPSNKLSVLHTVIIQVGDQPVLRSANPYKTSFNKTATVVAIISLALGIALATKMGVNFFVQKHRKRKVRRTHRTSKRKR